MLIEISIENKDKIIKKCLEDVRLKYKDFKIIDVNKLSISSEKIRNTEFGTTFEGILYYPKLDDITLSNYELFIDVKGYIHFHIWYIITNIHNDKYNDTNNIYANCDIKHEVISYNLDDLAKELNYLNAKDLINIK